MEERGKVGPPPQHAQWGHRKSMKLMCETFDQHYTVEIFRLSSLGLHRNTPTVLFMIDFNSGSKFTNVDGGGRYQKRFREHEQLFWGALRK